MRFQCSHCQGILAVDEFEPGEAVACGHCGSVVAVPESRVSPGALVGDFVIGKKLGEGGMGAVYLAHQVSLDREAAVKILHQRYLQDGAYIQDFIREARAAAALNHPAIVQAYAVGDDEGLFYFAMEYVEGSTLQHVLTHGGRMVVDRALAIAVEITEALDFAWRRQALVHRDIKPDNIILTAGGHAKLADLGLARKLTETTDAGDQELYGTPQYIAPEQLLGSAGDNRSDIYSLGATLYHALSGRFPYTGDSPADIARKHLTDVLPPLRSVLPDIPEDVARIVEMALAKRPAHRFKDTAELLADLKRVRDGQAPGCVPAPGAQRPIDLEAGDADLLVGAPDATPEVAAPGGAKKLTLVRRPAAVTDPAAAVPVDAADHGAGPAQAVKAPTPEREDSAAVNPGAAEPGSEPGSDAPRSRRKGRFAALLVLLLLLLGVGGGAVYWFVLQPGAGGRGQGHGSLADGTSGNALAVLEEIESLAGGDAADAEVVSALAAYVERFEVADETVAARFHALAAPYVEARLGDLRAGPRQDDLSDWQARSTTLQEAAKRAQEEAEKQRREEAETQQRLAAEEREKSRREAFLADMTRKQDELRQAAARLCQDHDYSGAALLFAGMTSSREAEFRQWAEMKQDCTAEARKLFEQIANTGALLAGTPFTLPREKGDWEVVDIGYTAVQVKSRVIRYERGEAREVIREVKVPLAGISAGQMYQLAKSRWEREPAPAGSLALQFGCYLLARGEFLDEARKQLQSAGLEGARFLDEIEPMAPVAKEQEFRRYLRVLREVAEGGEGGRARLTQMAAQLQARFPDQYEAFRADIERILAEE